jgi:hypothetical protein
VLAAIWYIANVFDSAKIAIDTGRSGRRTTTSSAAQAQTAIGPIHRSLVSGPIRLVNTGVATAAPT